MKLLSVSFVLLLIHTNYFLYAAAQQAVLDSDGDEVKPGVEYCLRYPIGFRGGVGLPFGSCFLCPAPVIEMPFETQIGLPVTFQPIDSTAGAIRENSTKLYIRFPGTVTGCIDRAGVWRVEYDESARKFYVVAASLVANPSTHFRLVKYKNSRAHTIATCPRIAGLRCLHIGTHQQNRLTRLAVNDQNNNVPYPVVFSKKPSAVIKLPE